MAYKKLLTSVSGAYNEINVYVDNNIISSSYPIISNTASILASNGILQINNNNIISLTGGNEQNQSLFYSNGNYELRTVSSAALGGDLSSSAGKFIVSNISNVVSGTLNTLYGGTNRTTILTGGLVTTNLHFATGSNTGKIITIGADSHHSIATSSSYVQFTELSPTVYLYTGSVSASNGATTGPFTWTKPANARFIRIICQGGGGGGARASSTQTLTTGGGGGGFSDVTFDAFTLAGTVSVTPGCGGAGGTNIPQVGYDGGDSSFGTLMFANGGQGGRTSNSVATTASGDIGYIQSGGLGSGQSTGGVIDNRSSVYIGGAGGGGGSGTNATNQFASIGGSILKYNLTGSAVATSNTTLSPGSPMSGTMFPNITQCYINGAGSLSSFPYLLWAGGSGGSGQYTAGPAGSGSSPEFGSGGGGGSRSPSAGPGLGGNGGKGYVLVICW